MRASFFGVLVVTITAALVAGCGEAGEWASVPKPTATAAKATSAPASAGAGQGSTWGKELVYLRPVEASIPWHEWTLLLNDWGNVQERRVTTDGFTLDEYHELVTLERIADANPRDANLWPTVFSLSTASDQVRVDLDATRYIEKAGMNLSQKLYAEEAYATYMRQAYAYSRGNLKIGLIRRDPLEPFVGEYSGATFFWPGKDLDIGRNVEPMSFDSMNGIWFPGPVHPWSRGATSGGYNWGYFAGHTSVQFAPGREAGHQISDVAGITLHEWLHQIAGMRWHLGYFGLPGQYDPGNYNAGSHLYYQHYIITPRMWRDMHHRDAQKAAPNKPKLRRAGYLLDWLVCGEFEGDEREAIARDVVHQVWTSIQVQGRRLTPEERAFPESEAVLLPDEGDELMGKKWMRHAPTRDLLEQDAYDEELDMVFLRRDGRRGEFPVRRKNVFVYAATYVWSPADQDATVWAGSMTPFKLYLNGEECFRCGRGTVQDDAVRDVRLRTGWNRVLVQTVDQGEDHWRFSVKFTDRDRNDLPELKVSAARPADLDAQAIVRVDKEHPCVPPIEVPLRYYSWEGDVADDWWGALPVLNEQHFEALFGQKGVRVDGGRDLGRPVSGPDRSGHDKTLFVDVAGLTGIRSRVAAERSSYDAVLNNLMNQAVETAALIRYTQPTTGAPRDLLLVRIDMVEPYMDMIHVADPRPLRDSIIGVILRDTKQAVVFETFLGDPLPANELSLLAVRDQDVALRAWPSVPRVVRGEPLNLNLAASYLSAEVGHAIRLEDVELKFVQQLRTETADTTTLGHEEAESLEALLPGETLTMEVPVATRGLRAGIVTYLGSVSYTLNGERHTLTRPVPVNVFDPVDVTVNIDGSSLLTKPQATASVVVHNNMAKRVRGTLRLELPDGWKASPTKESFKLDAQDDEARFAFDLTLPPNAASTTYVLRAAADVGAARGVQSTGEHQVQVALGDALVHEDFEHVIPSDFGHTDGLYTVQLKHDEDDRPIAFKGSTCLLVQDSGGARFGHVFMFGHDRFWPAGWRKANTTYTYDTNDYPIVEWWMRSDGRDANLGLNIRLETDRDQPFYGVLLHGLWEQQWDPSQRLDTVAFAPDERWHKITINLDELLDAYLGDEPHLVREVRFGDTRIFASGWWTGARKYRHYIDEFTIRKARPDEQHASPANVLLLAGDDRPPAFELPEVHGNLVLTIRPREVSTTQNELVFVDGWISNLGDAPVAVPRFPESGRFAIKLVDAQGDDVFDDQEGGWLDVSPKEPSGGLVTLKRNESARWSLDRDGAIPLGEPVEQFLKKKTGSFLIPAGTYTLSAKVAWGDQIEIVSNTIPLVVTPALTKDELLERLKSPYERERAQAVTALYKGSHFDTLPAIVAMLRDPDATVRLNAAYAIGELARQYDRYLQEKRSTTSGPAGGSTVPGEEGPSIPALWSPAIQALIDALNDDNWRVGEYAGAALANTGDPRAIEPLTKRLQDKSPWIRRRAAEALADCEFRTWAYPKDGAEANPETAAARLAFDRLVAVMDNEMPSTRLAAFQAARKFVGRPAGADESERVQRDAFVPVVRKAFGDACWNVRVEAAKVAAEWPDEDFSEELAAMLEDRDWIAREQLAGALTDLGNRRADGAVSAARAEAEANGDTLSDEQAAAVALEAKQPQIELLKTLLTDERVQVRWAAVQGLNRLKTGQTVEQLTGHTPQYWRVLTN